MLIDCVGSWAWNPKSLKHPQEIIDIDVAIAIEVTKAGGWTIGTGGRGTKPLAAEQQAFIQVECGAAVDGAAGAIGDGTIEASRTFASPVSTSRDALRLGQDGAFSGAGAAGAPDAITRTAIDEIAEIGAINGIAEVACRLHATEIMTAATHLG